MGKRSEFARIDRDFYPTPEAAVQPLLPHLSPQTLFIEPCAGDGALVDALQRAGHVCTFASDIEPQADGIHQRDALRLDVGGGADCVITNPPWARPILHNLIEALAEQKPTWLLFDADWMHTKQSAPFMPWLRKVVSVGRVKWFADSPHTGKDNCAWYLFDVQTEGETVFIGRTAQPNK